MGCFVLLTQGIACSESIPVDDDDPGQWSSLLIPDNTVFIASVLEASPDTTFHHAEVYVGYATDVPEILYHSQEDPSFVADDVIWSPMLYAQVAFRCARAGFRLLPEEAASVAVVGPLGTAAERRVVFEHEAGGNYGDLARQLDLQPRERYRLEVELPGERRYRAEMGIPDTAGWTVPDTVALDLSLQGASESSRFVAFPVTLPEEIADTRGLTLAQYNSDSDAALYQLSSVDEFEFADRGPFLRAGSYFGVSTNYKLLEDNDIAGVSWHLSYPGAEEWTESQAWLRLAVIGPDWSNAFLNPLPSFATDSDDPVIETLDRYDDAVELRQPSYLHEISNIEYVGPPGADSADANPIGLFRGYTARYATTVLKLQRSWDPNAVVTD